MMLRRIINISMTTAIVLIAWHAVVSMFSIPKFIVPNPASVGLALVGKFNYFIYHASVTATEALLGLFFGVLMGVVLALTMSLFRVAKRFFMPFLVISQALPVFAIAPLLVLWFGYGLGSKVVMATLIIFFPVTSYFYDGIRQTEPALLDLGQLYKTSRFQVLFHIRVPHALPSLSSALRVSAVFAPIGAIVGEWVGSSKGLGFIMLHANARMQTNDTFAALFMLAVMALLLRYSIVWATNRLVHWQNEEKGNYHLK